jgi:hypothetical protein
MRIAKFGICGCAVIAGLSLAPATHAANLSINDSVPGQLTLNWSDFQYGVRIDGGPFLPATSSATVAGESVTFFGDWIDLLGGNTGAGVIFIVDPGQPSLIRARIDAVWTDNFDDAQFDVLTVTSSPFGSDLGTLPAAFVGLGIPMPDGSTNITGMFRDAMTAAPVSHPPILTMQYVGDLGPECEHPTLFQALPDLANGYPGELDSNGGSHYESAETIMFADDVVVRSLRWWGMYYFAATIQADADDFILRVYEDAGGVPAQDPVATFHLSDAVRAGTGNIVAGLPNLPEFVYAASLPAPLALEGGKTYWLAIVNNTVADPDDGWFWSTANNGGSLAFRTPPSSGVWSNQPSDLAFELCGDALSLECPTDFDGDGFTSGADLAVLLANWGPCGPPLPLVVPTEPARLEMLMNPADDASAVTGSQR